MIRMTTRAPTPAEITPERAPKATAQRIGPDARQAERKRDGGSAVSGESGELIDQPSDKITHARTGWRPRQDSPRRAGVYPDLEPTA